MRSVTSEIIYIVQLRVKCEYNIFPQSFKVVSNLETKALLVGIVLLLVGFGIERLFAPTGGWTIGYAFAYFYFMFARK